MPLELRIPARINILGNPSDGLEGDFSTISAAVSVFAGASLGKRNLFMETWRKAASQAGLDAAQVYQVRVVHHGIEIKGH